MLKEKNSFASKSCYTYPGHGTGLPRLTNFACFIKLEEEKNNLFSNIKHIWKQKLGVPTQLLRISYMSDITYTRQPSNFRVIAYQNYSSLEQHISHFLFSIYFEILTSGKILFKLTLESFVIEKVKRTPNLNFTCIYQIVHTFWEAAI